MEEYFKFFKDLFGTNLIYSTSNKKIEKLLLNDKSLVTFSKKDNIEEDIVIDISKLFNCKLISLKNNLVYIFKLDYDIEKNIFYKRLLEAFMYSENSLKKILSKMNYLIELENMFSVLGRDIDIIDESYE